MLVIDEARAYLASRAPVGPFLADQLLVPLALAGGGTFVTSPLSRHSETNIDVIRRFLDVAVSVTPDSAGRCVVEVTEAGRGLSGTAAQA